MQKKMLVLLLAAVCAVSCLACAGKEEIQPDGSTQKETDPMDEETGAGTVVWESPLGYSMTYDPAVFTLDNTGETDVFTYHTAEKLDAPVYLSIQAYPDMDAQTLAEGLVLQSGIDGVEVQDAYFGAAGVETKLVNIEKEVEGVKQIQIFYAIPIREGSLLVEMGAYVGVPELVDGKLEEMLGTFTLTHMESLEQEGDRTYV